MLWLAPLFLLLWMGRLFAAEPVPLIWSTEPLLDEDPSFALESAPPPVVSGNRVALIRAASRVLWSLPPVSWDVTFGIGVYDTKNGELLAGGHRGRGSRLSHSYYHDSAADANDHWYNLEDGLGARRLSTLEGLWGSSRKLTGSSSSQIAVGPAPFVYFTDGGTLYCMRAEGGTLQFRRQFTNWLTGIVVGTENRLYVLSSPQLLAIDSVLGQTLWTYHTGTGAGAREAVLRPEDNELITFHPLPNEDYPAMVVGLNPDTGEKIWSFTAPLPGHRVISGTNGVLYYSYSPPGSVHGPHPHRIIAVDTRAQKALWEWQTPAINPGEESGPFLLENEQLYWGSRSNIFLLGRATVFL